MTGVEPMGTVATERGCPRPRAADAVAPPSTSTVREEAAAFYALPELAAVASPERLAQVRASIDATGTYEHTGAELLLGAKIAWRNHARCSGRASWQSLELYDARHCSTPAEVAQACWEHLRLSTNGGRLRALITVFRPRRADDDGIEIVNPQLIRYAGYRNPDGSVTGDPLHVELTDLARHLGWRGAGGAFDVLPLMLRVDGGPVQLFDVPADAVLEIPLSHPEYDWFAGLGLRWHANPAISNLTLEIGGLAYTASPFSGWYVSSEIGARNLGDDGRYAMLRTVADGMGLDTSRNDTLWRDRALVELNQAVLHSYRRSGVHILDHHTAASQFVRHVDREHAQGRPVPADWAWVNPPMSASTTPTFHRTYDPPDFSVRPNFVARQAGGCPVTGG